MKGILFDAESDGFLFDATKIHCIAYQRFDTLPNQNGAVTLTQEPETVVNHIKEADVIIGHHMAGFDIPLIEELYAIDLSDKLIYDTYLGSCLVYPNNPHGHSLEAWAKKLNLKYQKIEVDDWSRYSQKMGERCINDVRINAAVACELASTWCGDFDHPVMKTETAVARIHAKQELDGVRFDVMGASKLLDELDWRIAAIREEITAGVPPAVKPRGKTIELPYTQAGTISKRVENLIGPQKNRVGPMSGIDIIPFNLDSPSQVSKYLLSIGWKPTEWNYIEKNGVKERSSPKLTESSWGSLPGDLGKKIGRYKVMNHRRNWIQNSKDPQRGALKTVRSDGRVPAEAMTCATPTSRYRHMRTVCNIPRPSSPWGNEIRALFTVEKDSWMLGVDLSGIEARMLAHYVSYYNGGKELADVILNGDFHQHNADMWNVTRDQAKTALYALMYGCGPAKLAAELGVPANQGKRQLDKFWHHNFAARTLVDNLERAWNSGKPIASLDGRIMDVRREQTLLNTLLQTAAAVVFKLWMIKVNEHLREHGLNEEVVQVIAYHDELQFEFFTPDKQLVEDLGVLVVRCAEEVGRDLNLKVPITAEAKVGKNWKETH